jgi:spore germination protein KA
VVYIEDLTNEQLVSEVIKRLNDIDIDSVISAGYIEGYIIDKKSSLFPQIINTERSDKFCGYILEGRVGILIDGLPVAYIVPASIDMFFQAPEDYAYNFYLSSFIRLLRYAGAFISLLLPAFYVAITTFHQEMIPTILTISIIRSKMEVPFPTFISILGMLIAFEILLEAGLRLPRTIGQAVSIIGGTGSRPGCCPGKNYLSCSCYCCSCLRNFGLYHAEPGYGLFNTAFQNCICIKYIHCRLIWTVIGFYPPDLSYEHDRNL